MKSLIAILTLLTSVSVFADVCQVKPSGVIKDNGIFENINVWSLKKGDETVKDYTFYDIDLSKAISERNALISAGLCKEELLLEKCKIEVERHDSHAYVFVYIGQTKALAFGGQAEFDMHSLDVAAEHMDKLTSAGICSRD